MTWVITEYKGYKALLKRVLKSIEDDLRVFQAGATDSVMLRQFLTRVLWRECFRKDLSFLFAQFAHSVPLISVWSSSPLSCSCGILILLLCFITEPRTSIMVVYMV